MKQKTVSALGLDIGSYSIKCVEITRPKESLELHRAMILPLSKEVSSNVADALKSFLNPGQFISKRIRISLSGPSLLIRRIRLPRLTHAEVKSAIRFEAESQIPFPINDCMLDFQILEPAPDKMMNVLLVAAKRDFIQSRLALVASLGLPVEIIDVDIFCLINAFQMLNDEKEQRTYGLLNLGHRTSSFAIMKDRFPFFVREIPLGGIHVAQALAQSKGISEEQADVLKKIHATAEAQEVMNATRQGFDPLAEELGHSIDYVENETGEALTGIWISGGGALSEGVAAILSEGLGKTVSLWNNTKKLEISKNVEEEFLSEHSSEFNVAYGMALRGLGQSK